MLTNMQTPPVVLVMNKRSFIEDNYLVVDCLYDQKKMKPLLKDWIGLYPYKNIKLYEPLIFEYVMDHPRINESGFKIRFMPQLFSKFVHCSGKYQFVYVNSNFKIIASSDPIEFVHKNDCNCNFTLGQSNCIAHVKIGQDINVVIQRLKCLEARLLDYEEGKKEVMQLNEQLVNKLEACEMLRSRGEQFIDSLYNALDQGNPVKLTNSKGHIRWIKLMNTTKIRNHIMSTKTVKNDLYLTAIINSQEQEIQKLQAINNELKVELLKYHEQMIHEPKSEDSETDIAEASTQVKTFTNKCIPSAVVNFIDDDLEISDDYCE